MKVNNPSFVILQQKLPDHAIFHYDVMLFQEVVTESGKPKVKNTTVPALASASLFHEVCMASM